MTICLPLMRTSGQLTTATNADLDYETQRDYEVIVTVSDGANPSLSDTIRVIIRLTNDRTDDAAVVNRAPYFNRNEGDGLLTERTVPENTPKDMNIGDVLGATDDDAGDDLTFAFATEDNADSESFDIDPDTGQLTTKEEVTYNHEDEDNMGTYSVKVTVSDGKDEDGDPDSDAVDDTITVTITVEDVNEGPMFTTDDGN